MKKNLPVALLICGLIGITSMSNAKDEPTIDKKSEQVSAFCVVDNHIVVNEPSVIVTYFHQRDRFLEMVTSKGHKIRTDSHCTFKQVETNEVVSMGLNDGNFQENR